MVNTDLTIYQPDINTLIVKRFHGIIATLCYQHRFLFKEFSLRKNYEVHY